MFDCTLCCVQDANKITHVIFGLDGTLFDSENFRFQAMSKVCSSYGKEHTQEIYLKILGYRIDTAVQIIIDTLKLPTTVEELKHKYLDELLENVGDAPPASGALELIKYFRENNIPVAGASSSTQEEYDAKYWRHVNFFEMFSHQVLTGDPDVKEGKPSPDIYLVTASRFENPPNPRNCLVFEDSPIGVKAAVAAGMKCVMIPNKCVPEELTKEAHLVIECLEDFTPEFFGLPRLLRSSVRHSVTSRPSASASAGKTSN